jgi:membrane associated rhomboid family serine protease
VGVTNESATTAPTCYRHPDRSTLLSCTRCGLPICSECSVDSAVGQRCVECVRKEGYQATVPVRSSVRSAAPVTVGIVAVTAIFFLLQMMGFRQPLAEALAQINFAVADGQWWRIFTAALLHGSGFTHILFNMWALWVLGPQIERGVGTGPYLALYVASAGVGGAFYFWSGVPFAAVGASGAIFGLFGVWLSWAIHRRNTAQGRALLSQVGFLILINAALPFIVPNIAWQAHLGGLVAGFIIAEIWSRIRGPQTTTYRTLVGIAVALLAVIAVL